MSEEAPKEAAIEGASVKLVACGVVTVLWLIAAISIGYFAHSPMDDPSCKGTFSCLTASEWGDFLAGVFAPVAFFWLVVTVWIQSDELREQRKELALTRKEFELNRSVMEEEAQAARSQAGYLATQTALLDDEANARKREANFTSFITLTSRYVEHSREIREGVFYRLGSSTGYIFSGAPTACSHERYVYLQWLHATAILDEGSERISIVGADIFEEAFIFIYGAEEIVNLIPYHSRVSWQRSKLGPLLDCYCQLVLRDPQLSHLNGYVSARDRRLGRDAMEVST
ncbi:hypothetical protein [Rhizobium bangladeshense]|uniref:hypothetical protein n=1 Tax=Rhizobium bangladeshense TaxID=1138189 RepID=UPI001C92B623|nr:hypothetical protein [Rhizobium bangladeshense]MBY3595989.1 hypothetical protein [Rhizobium bangladeshense]